MQRRHESGLPRAHAVRIAAGGHVPARASRAALNLGHAVLVALLAAAAPAAAQRAASTRDYLREFDRDGDGRVSLHEYQDKLSEVFLRMDLNGNGIVDLSEFDPAVVGPNTRPVSLARHRARLADVFRRQDADRNGYLDARELAAPPR